MVAVGVVVVVEVVAGVLLAGEICWPITFPKSSASRRTRNKYSSAVAGGSPAFMRVRITRSDMPLLSNRDTGKADMPCVLFLTLLSLSVARTLRHLDPK